MVFVGFLQADLLAPWPATLSPPRRGTGRPEHSRQTRGGAGEANTANDHGSGGGERPQSFFDTIRGLETMREMEHGMAAELGRAAILEARLLRATASRHAVYHVRTVPLVLASVTLVSGVVLALYLDSVSHITPPNFHHHA